MKNQNTLLQINNYGMGHGDESLGLKLIGNYLKLSLEDDRLPKIIVFYNSGVKLLCEGSPVIEILKRTEAADTKLMACKTCLDHYNLTDKIQLGIPCTMMDIITLQAGADKVVTL
ncbi:MAG: DsrE family protein [Bacteroidales bacterium]|nr:DsrE family protein [Bacteroidales bacterium]